MLRERSELSGKGNNMAEKETKKYLRERLGRISSEKRVYWGDIDKKLPKPAQLIEAERRMKRDAGIVNRFAKRERVINDRRKKRKIAMHDACERAIIFGTPSQALKMLDKFERMKF